MLSGLFFGSATSECARLSKSGRRASKDILVVFRSLSLNQ